MTSDAHKLGHRTKGYRTNAGQRLTAVQRSGYVSFKVWHHLAAAICFQSSEAHEPVSVSEPG